MANLGSSACVVYVCRCMHVYVLVFVLIMWMLTACNVYVFELVHVCAACVRVWCM